MTNTNPTRLYAGLGWASTTSDCGQTFNTQPWLTHTSRERFIFHLFFREEICKIWWTKTKFHEFIRIMTWLEFNHVVSRQYKPFRTHTLKLAQTCPVPVPTAAPCLPYAIHCLEYNKPIMLYNNNHFSYFENILIKNKRIFINVNING